MKRKIYHIIHINNLKSIINKGFIFSHKKALENNIYSINIGMNKIKQRRLHIKLSKYSDLYVGECVPFYFCPRSVMLYVLYRGNNWNLEYEDGQEKTIHLEADLFKVIDWAERNNKRWVFTDSNAGSKYFYDYNSINDLEKLDWDAIFAEDWSISEIKEKKQSEFLCENSVAWKLIDRIGVINEEIYNKVKKILKNSNHKPEVIIKREWYY